MEWLDCLTEEEIKHLITYGVKTISMFKDMRSRQVKLVIICNFCEDIESKLKEAKLW